MKLWRTDQSINKRSEHSYRREGTWFSWVTHNVVIKVRIGIFCCFRSLCFHSFLWSNQPAIARHWVGCVFLFGCGLADLGGSRKKIAIVSKDGLLCNRTSRTWVTWSSSVKVPQFRSQQPTNFRALITIYQLQIASPVAWVQSRKLWLHEDLDYSWVYMLK